MEIQHIFEFLELAKTCSFSKAASNLYISQSSLSKHLMMLEDEVGATLFDRSARSVSLSEYGKIFLPYARKLWSLYRESLLRIEKEKITHSYTVSIALIQDSHYYQDLTILFDFQKTYPEYSVNVIEASEEEEFRLFRNRKVNLIGVSVSDAEERDYDFLPHGRSRIVVAFPENHPCRGQASVKAADLIFEPLILPSRGMKVFGILVNTIVDGREELTPNIVFEGSPDLCLQFAAKGMGVLLQPLEVIVSAGLPYAELDPPVELYYGLGYRDYASLSEGERLLVDFSRHYAQNV